MKIDGVTAIALVVIASFAIDRIVSAVMFLAVYAGIVQDPDQSEPRPEGAHPEKVYKLIYFVLAGILGVGVLAFFGNVRVLRALGLIDVNPIVDAIITGLLLMGGAERISGFVQPAGRSSAEKPEAREVHVTGTLKVEDAAGRMSGTLKAGG
jgi:hypothetical protein